MAGLLTIPDDFNVLLKKYGIKTYNNYKLPKNYNDLSPLEKNAENCKVNDSKLIITKKEYILGNYIKDLNDNINKDSNNNFISLKLLFIYNYLQNKSINDFEDDFIVNDIVDNYIEIDLLKCELKYYYKDLLQNYNSYCILKDYIDNRFGNNDNVKYDKLDFINYNNLEFDELVFFLKNIKMELMDYREMFELILTISTTDKQKFYNLYSKYELDDIFSNIELYNIYPYEINNDKQEQIVNDNYTDDEYEYSSSEDEVLDDDFDL
jgi:hypothetical protein